MIFNGPIDKITGDDVAAFCDRGIRENFVLDYKRDFPKDLGKTIAALANTYGGVVLIGVGDNDGKPIVPPSGIKFERGLTERVNQIVIDNIYPPVFPEIQVCPAQKERAFVVVRVPQSEDTPHAVLGRKHIYVRTQNVTKPEEWEDFATTDQIEWLWDRRKKAKELRLALIQNAESRATACQNINNMVIPFGVARFVVAPRYPHSPLATLEEMHSIHRDVVARGYHGHEFPDTMHDAEGIQQGIMLLNVIKQRK